VAYFFGPGRPVYLNTAEANPTTLEWNVETLMNTLQVAVCSSGPVTCATSSVEPSGLQDRHVFGRQYAAFADVPLRLDLVLVLRVYVDEGGSRRLSATSRTEDADEPRSVVLESGRLKSGRTSMEIKAAVPEDNLILVAWTFLPLVVRGTRKLWLVFLWHLVKFVFSS